MRSEQPPEQLRFQPNRVTLATEESRISAHPLVLALAIFFLAWMAVVAVRGALLALQVFDLPIIGEALDNYATPEMVLAAALVYLVGFVAAIIARVTYAPATLPVTFATGCIVVLAGAAGTGSISSLTLVIAGFIVAWVVGNALVRHVPAAVDIPLVRAPLAIALGLVLLGLGLFLLAALSLLNPMSVAILIGLQLAGGLMLQRTRIIASADRLRLWRPPVPSWFETIATGALVGLVAFAILAAFVPEVQTDATREHLPIAREIWQTGSVAEFPPMGVSRDPIQGHLLYAVAYGVGGTTAATLVQTLTGLTAFAGIAAIGWMIAGRIAALASAVIFATMPIVLWQLGHAFLDLYPVLFTVTAAACLLLWQRVGTLRWLTLAGALAGFGFACKVTMGWSIVGLAAGIVLVGRGPWQWRERIRATAIFALAAAAITLPWLVRGFVIGGSIPGAGVLRPVIDAVLPQLAGQPGPSDPTSHLFDASAREATLAHLEQFGLGHSPANLVGGLWALTFHGEQFRFPLIGHGEIGIALLMLLPLALFGPRNRATAFLAIAAIVSYVIWFLTPHQIARHLLPTLAIAATLAGIGLESAITGTYGTPRPLSRVAPAGLLLACLATPLLFLPSSRATLPVDLLLGRERPETYVQRAVPSGTALLASSQILSPETPVAYIGGDWEGPQIYTEARLLYPIAENLGTTAEAVLANLDRIGVRYVIWNRTDSYERDWRSTLLSADFLERHARILAGDRNAYLFEILPERERRWGTGTPGNLLADPDLTTALEDDGPWASTGKVRDDGGHLTVRRNAVLSQQIPISAGVPYLFTVATDCEEPSNVIELSIRWLDSTGAEIGAATERVTPGTNVADQFIWRAAPENASSVQVAFRVVSGTSCQLDSATLQPAP